MAKKSFKIRAHYVFPVEFSVQAHTRQEAEQLVQERCAVTMVTTTGSADERVKIVKVSDIGDIVISRRAAQQEEGEE
jgi:hypothetical protein